jgi:hypothetical protein
VSINKLLTPFWFEFNLDNYPYKHFFHSKMGYGVTAFDVDDALMLLQKEAFNNNPLPNITKQIENIAFDDIEQNHVMPNIGFFIRRGVWYPKLNS